MEMSAALQRGPGPAALCTHRLQCWVQVLPRAGRMGQVLVAGAVFPLPAPPLGLHSLAGLPWLRDVLFCHGSGEMFVRVGGDGGSKCRINYKCLACACIPHQCFSWKSLPVIFNFGALGIFNVCARTLSTAGMKQGSTSHWRRCLVCLESLLLLPFKP